MHLRAAVRPYKHLLQFTGFVAACLGIYSWWTAPVARLQAEIYFADFEMPAPVVQQFAALTPLTEAETAKSEFFHPNLRHRIMPDTGGTVDQILNNLAAYVKEKAPAVERRDEVLYKGFWRVRVRNLGSRAVSNVMIRFPMPASAVVSRPAVDRTPVQQLPATTSQAFAVGTIQGGDDVAVLYAWTLSPATDELARKIAVTHDLGAGRIRISR